jgi:hypothetical protein
VAQLAEALRAIARSIRDGRSPEHLPLPDSADVRQLADRIGDVRRALTDDQAA